MDRLALRPLVADDVPACARLLAARQRRDRTRLPVLAPRFEDAAQCETVLAGRLGPLADGAVAEAGGRLVGFLLGERQLHAPREYLSYFVEPYSVVMPLHAHAVALDADSVAVVRALYGALAGVWVARGFFVHTAHVVAGDAALQEAWLSLGFGRKATCAVRPTAEPLPAASPTPVEIRHAAATDLEAVARLMHVNALHHASAPLFWPYLRETVDAGRAYAAALLDDRANGHVLAQRGGRVLGMQTFTPPTFLSPLLVPPRMIYLFHGVVEAEARGEGIGSALLARSMAWAREQGHEHCALHFGSANLAAAAFWTGQGFVPIEHSMQRRIDERVAWAGSVEREGDPER
jgi:GNAT superfamily N-acetyltransferase